MMDFWIQFYLFLRNFNQIIIKFMNNEVVYDLKDVQENYCELVIRDIWILKLDIYLIKNILILI